MTTSACLIPLQSGTIVASYITATCLWLTLWEIRRAGLIYRNQEAFCNGSTEAVRRMIALTGPASTGWRFPARSMSSAWSAQRRSFRRPSSIPTTTAWWRGKFRRWRRRTLRLLISCPLLLPLSFVVPLLWLWRPTCLEPPQSLHTGKPSKGEFIAWGIAERIPTKSHVFWWFGRPLSPVYNDHRPEHLPPSEWHGETKQQKAQCGQDPRFYEWWAAEVLAGCNSWFTDGSFKATSNTLFKQVKERIFIFHHSRIRPFIFTIF